jgi:hypothetical protein
VRALHPESGGIENMHPAPEGSLTAGVGSEEVFDSQVRADWRKFSDVIGSADFEFRNRIASDNGPQAYVRDPKNGERLQLAKEEWIIPAGRLYLALGFPDDFVWHDDSDPLPNPGIPYGPVDTLVDGYLRPVFFLRDEFGKFIAGISAAPMLAGNAAAPGRPSIMKTIIKPELDRWIASGHAGLAAKLNEYGQGDGKSRAAITRALESWARAHGHSDAPSAKAIENDLREKITTAYNLL